MIAFSNKQLEFLVFVNSLEDWNYRKLASIVAEVYTARQFGTGYSTSEYSDKEIYRDGMGLSQEEFEEMVNTLKGFSPEKLFNLQTCLLQLDSLSE